MEDIIHRLKNLGEKWRWANPEVTEVCRDAILEIALLRVKIEAKVSKQSPPQSTELGWGKGKDE